MPELATWFVASGLVIRAEGRHVLGSFSSACSIPRRFGSSALLRCSRAAMGPRLRKYSCCGMSIAVLLHAQLGAHPFSVLRFCVAGECVAEVCRTQRPVGVGERSRPSKVADRQLSPAVCPRESGGGV